jgi:hypothetical protein
MFKCLTEPPMALQLSHVPTGNQNQPEFDFNATTPARDPITAWREQRQMDLQKLARQLGLPLGHPVEVRLRDGVILSGPLQLGEETLLLSSPPERRLQLRVDGVCFAAAEIEACVRLD